MKLLDFIVCDDIRQERGDKLSFMGVFGDTIKLQIPKGASRPVPFRVAAFFRILVEDQDVVPDRFKIVIKMGTEVAASFEGGIGAKGKPRLMGFPLPQLPVPAFDDGILSFQALFFAGDKLLLDATPAYGTSVQLVEVESIPVISHGAPT